MSDGAVAAEAARVGYDATEAAASVREAIASMDVEGMSDEQAEAAAARLGFDASALHASLQAALQRAGEAPLGEGRPKMSNARAMVEIMLDVDAREIEEMSAAQVEEQAARLGYDAGVARGTVDKALKAAGLRPVAAASTGEGPKPVARVVDLQSARGARAPQATRWGLLAAAAAVALTVGGGGAQWAANYHPVPTVTYPTSTPGPSVLDLAAIVRARGLRQCDLGYTWDCQQNLDLAEKYDPNGERLAEVSAARGLIAAASNHSGPRAELELYSKQVPAPRERKLVPMK